MANPIALVVEDEKDIARIFAKALRGSGFEVEIVHAGDEAIEWLGTRTPHLVILDLQMPRVSGAEVLAHIRAQPQLSEVVVIIATAYPHIADELANEADHVLYKPVSYAELRALAARFVPGTSQN
jgi:two-component system phosphate regulon response regulator PhoB